MQRGICSVGLAGGSRQQMRQQLCEWLQELNSSTRLREASQCHGSCSS